VSVVSAEDDGLGDAELVEDCGACGAALANVARTHNKDVIATMMNWVTICARITGSRLRVL
jgi:hypothetical protein